MPADQDMRAGIWNAADSAIFADPSSHALSRVAVIDVGSNSVRMVIFDGAARSPAYFFNEKVMCALGAGLAETGRLNPEGRERALTSLKRFIALAAGFEATPVLSVATAAMREAADGPEFCDQVAAETGLQLNVISGEEEARLSAQGVLLGWPGATGLMCDIGGSSMELAEIRDGAVGPRISSKLGPLLLRGRGDSDKDRRAHIAKTVKKLAQKMGRDHDRLFLVGGSWRAIARIDMIRRDYPLAVLHEYSLGRKSLLQTLDYIAETSVDDLRAMTSKSAERMALVPIAAEVLRELVTTFAPRDIFVSSYGIREGVLYEQMSERQRARDPLIEACRFAEISSARIPGFGRQLFDFVKPLFADNGDLRLIKAACLLHDTTWRSHPDYRHEVCFENATRANLGGLDHPGRVFLGLALLHRYKNSRDNDRFAPLLKLLDDERIAMAETLGKAMRLGAMFAAESDRLDVRLDYRPKDKRLTLMVAPPALPLIGDLCASRLASLAKSLGADSEITLCQDARELSPDPA